jgi:RNA polymerase sigma-70 factor, ECF subfamily
MGDGIERAGGSPGGDPESTADLVERAQQGDRAALDELFRRHYPALKRWARGRLPPWTRDLRDTDDLVQDTVYQTLRRLDAFEPRHPGGLRAYLRRALLNGVNDEVRRVRRIPGIGTLDDAEHVPDAGVSPLEASIGSEALGRYETALSRLKPEDQALIIARVEMQQTFQQIATTFGKKTPDAARMAVTRALVRLAKEMDRES